MDDGVSKDGGLGVEGRRERGVGERKRRAVESEHYCMHLSAGVSVVLFVLVLFSGRGLGGFVWIDAVCLLRASEYYRRSVGVLISGWASDGLCCLRCWS
jgi:hypothetical protein